MKVVVVELSYTDYLKYILFISHQPIEKGNFDDPSLTFSFQQRTITQLQISDFSKHERQNKSSPLSCYLLLDLSLRWTPLSQSWTCDSYLANRRQVSQTLFSFLFMNRTVGSILGYLLLKWIQKKYQRIQHKIIAVGTFITFIFAVVFVLFSSNLWTGISITVFEICQYCIFASCNISFLLIAKKKAGQWITFVNALYGVGALISPLIIRQFGTSAYYFFSALYLLVGIICLYFPSPTTSALQQNSSSNHLQEKQQIFQQASLKLQVAIGLGMFLSSGVTATISGWLPTYAVHTEKFNMREAATCSTLFWSSIAIFRFVSAGISMKNSLKLKILLGSIFCCSFGCLLLSHLSFQRTLVLFGSIFFGISCSAVYPLIISISTEYKIKFTPEQLSNMLIAPSFSSFLVAGMTGELMKFNSNLLFDCLAITSGALCLNALWFFKVIDEESPLKQLPMKYDKNN